MATATRTRRTSTKPRPVRPAKVYPARKRCTSLHGCGRMRLIKFFRLLTSGYRQGMCIDCERAYEAERWRNRRAS